MFTVTSFNEIKLGNDAERLIILRKRLNLNQFQFAKELGISVSYIGQMEREELPFSPHIKAKINEFLKREKELYGKDILSGF
ncbi:hypothetical protein AWM68_17750 [Fictibacillus phosphorivorans]|uniref:HTH cro/C1-type domain-containing protein n=1 Tax=Fictibacillus phosphorivorans TaxID=1221500 RepID=A0A161RUS7_9BACL|nr:helix-turn-helix transcriptional regulator [Fictibacillus phosphorivorans]KZE68016.1 hypothetical protein AWM68_17750 [Fictibacillus phosphorivorans]